LRDGGIRKFEFQHPFHSYILDFFFKKTRLCVEIDGNTHIGNEEYDARRDYYLSGHGIYTLRIPARDVFDNVKGVVRHIRKMLAEKNKVLRKKKGLQRKLTKMRLANEEWISSARRGKYANAKPWW